MNIAPTDEDVFDPEAYVGQTHVTPPEREALAELRPLGLHDVVRDRWPNEERVFTYWDYRAGMFHQDLGMRIDLVLAGGPVADRVKAAWVDRQARKGKGPSDHAPVIVDLDEAPDGDIGPVVPPPSAPAPGAARAKLPQQCAARVAAVASRPLGPVPVARGLHALGLSRHLRVVGRVGHVALALGERRARTSRAAGSSEWATSSIAAWTIAAPRRTERASSATVKSSGATSGSSSQASGADTGAPGFGRTL